MNSAQVCDPLLRPFGGDLIDKLPAALMETWSERSALIEYEAVTHPRALAEALALIELLRQHPNLLTGVTMLQLELAGGAEWLLTTDLDFARRHLAEVGGVEIAVINLAEVLNRQYGGLAMLTTLG
jgi:hypothetical protein